MNNLKSIGIEVNHSENPKTFWNKRRISINSTDLIDDSGEHINWYFPLFFILFNKWKKGNRKW